MGTGRDRAERDLKSGAAEIGGHDADSVSPQTEVFLGFTGATESFKNF